MFDKYTNNLSKGDDMHPMRRLSSSAALAVALALVAIPGARQSADAAEAPALKVSVVCVVSATSAFPYPAGKDYCFKQSNGQTATPEFVNACSTHIPGGTRLTFVFSAVPNPKCGGPARFGNQATQDEYEPGLQALSPREKAFFMAHTKSRE